MITHGNQSRMGLTWETHVRFNPFSLNFLLLISSLLFLHLSSHGQSCGHEHLESFSQNYLRELNLMKQTQRSVNRTSVELIKLKVFILRDNQGNAAPFISFANFLNGLEEANEYFKTANIRFEVCCDPIYVDNSSLVLPSNAFENFANEHDDPAYINVYIHHTNNTAYAGFGYYPGSKSRIELAGITPLIIAHEIGHVLGLFHTFGPNSNLTDELVDGSNCLNAGDFICDTPADPYPFGSYDPSSCQYTGAIVDANGDPYTPLMDNIMSYYTGNLCQSTFTQGQFNFMNSIIETSRFYYDGDSSTFHVNGFPGPLCVGDSTAYDLSEYAQNGFFSGPGISNNTLQVSGLSAGTYTVTVVDTSINHDSALVTDAAQIAYGTYLDTSYLWQAYKAIRSGKIDHVQLRFSNTTAQNITLKIYAGSGTSGQLLFNNSFPVSADTNNRWVKFSLNTSVQQTTGSTYTLEWTTSNGPIKLNHAYNDNTFGGGVSNKQLGSSIGTQNNTGYSWTYIVSCFTNQHQCDTLSFEYIIHEPNPYAYDFFPYDLQNRYCVDEAPVDLIGTYNAYNYYDSIMINGMRTSILNPDSIGPGVYNYSFKYRDDNHCPFSADTTLFIKGYPPLGIEQNMCITDDPINWASEHPNGSFWVNGQPASVFAPSIVGGGTHTIEAMVPNPYDTTYAGQNMVGYWNSLLEDSLETNETIGQTFIADTSGYIQRVAIITSSFKQYTADPDFQIEIIIREDIGFSGQVLYQDTLSVGDVFGEIDYVIPQYERIEVEKDSFYTVSLTRLDSNNSSNWIRYIYEPNNTANPGEIYRSGQFNQIGDFGFKLKYWMETHCGDYQTHTVTISDTPPNIALDDEYEACDSVTLNPGAALDYLWSDSSINASLQVFESGTYWVKASNGCEKSDTTEVLIHTTPVLESIVGEAHPHTDTSYTYSVVGAAGSVFNWNVTNGVILSGQNTSSVTIAWDSTATQGFITVSEISENDCESSPVSKPISIQLLGVRYPDNVLNAFVYPNPTNDVLIIRSANSEALNVRIYDMLGQLTMTRQVTADDPTLHLKSLPSGQYFLEISNESGLQRMFSVIKS